MARSVLFMHYAGSLVLFWRCFGLQRSYLFLSLIIIIKRKIVDLFLLVGGLQVYVETLFYCQIHVGRAEIPSWVMKFKVC